MATDPYVYVHTAIARLRAITGRDDLTTSIEGHIADLTDKVNALEIRNEELEKELIAERMAHKGPLEGIKKWLKEIGRGGQ